MFNKNILNRLSLVGSAYQLALIRILFGFQILFSSSSKIFDFLKIAPGTDYTLTIFPTVIQNYINIYAIDVIQLSVQVLSVFLIIGLFIRWVTPLLFIAFLLQFSFLYSKFDAPIPWLYIWFPLLVFIFSDIGAVWSIDSFLKKRKVNLTDSKYRWPVELLAGWWAYIYVAAGIAKILPFPKAILWFDGGTSQQIIYDRYLDSGFHFIFGQPFFDYTEPHYVFCILTIGSVIIELSAITIFITNRYNLLLLSLILSMHSFLFLAGVPGFGFLSLILGVSLINPEYVHKFIKHK